MRYTALRSFGAVAGLLLTLGAGGSTPTSVANPMIFLHYLVGRWSCSAQMGSRPMSYTATWSQAMNGTWLRAIYHSPAGSAEQLLTYLPQLREWQAVSVHQNGRVSILRAHDTGAAVMHFFSVYPDRDESVTATRVTPVKYTLTSSYEMAEKAMHASETCRKL